MAYDANSIQIRDFKTVAKSIMMLMKPERS